MTDAEQFAADHSPLAKLATEYADAVNAVRGHQANIAATEANLAKLRRLLAESLQECELAGLRLRGATRRLSPVALDSPLPATVHVVPMVATDSDVDKLAAKNVAGARKASGKIA